MDKFVGKRLDGRYEITELIGVGGMANVYKADDIVEDRVVAIKILKDEFSKNGEFLRRFKNESKAIALLSHPNIVRVLDVNFGDRIQYIVMEYISGITLKEYIEQQGVLKWKEAVHFTVQVLRALQHAHDNGIVHRDVKPQNIMLLQDGTIKVMDFGIARFARSDNKTLTDKAIGSVHYISPEQARGGKIDEKTDIYSVGVMMFEMLTGQLPFEADSAVSVAIMQMQAQPKRPREINETIPEGLEEIVIRAMQKDPSKRYQSAAEMLRDIDEFKRNPSILFEYKYFSDDAEGTKQFDAMIGDDDMEEDSVEPEAIEKKSHMIPILAGVAAAFVVVSIVVCVVIFGFSDVFSHVPEVEVPNLVGQVYDEVVNDPQYSNIKIEKKEEAFSSEYEAGIIIEQETKAGTKIKENQTLYVTVSKGISMQDVPDVYGKTEAEARDILKEEGLDVAVATTQQFDETVPKGCVIKTNPARGEQLKSGEKVQLYISMGTVESNATTVPNVVGRTVDEAKQRLAEKNLNCVVNEVDSNEPAGTVLSQNPVANSVAQAGDTVTIEVSNGKMIEKTVNVNISIPAGTTSNGKYFNIKVVKGNETIDSAEIKISGQATTRTVAVTGTTGTQDVYVYVSYNGNEKMLAHYSVDFDSESVSVLESNSSAFDSLVPEESESSTSDSSESSTSGGGQD